MISLNQPVTFRPANSSASWIRCVCHYTSLASVCVRVRPTPAWPVRCRRAKFLGSTPIGDQSARQFPVPITRDTVRFCRLYRIMRVSPAVVGSLQRRQVLDLRLADRRFVPQLSRTLEVQLASGIVAPLRIRPQSSWATLLETHFIQP